MGLLTNDMTRLRGEITALHGAREAGINDRKRAMSQMRAGFRSAFNEMAERARAQRFACVSGMRKDVADFRQGWAGELEGARHAWMGTPSSRRRSPR